MLHSTHINNNWLIRHIQPIDRELCEDPRLFDWNYSPIQNAPHFLIGKTEFNEFKSVQLLPMNIQGRAGGHGKSGTLDDKFLHVELCISLDNMSLYAKQVKTELENLLTYICIQCNINPRAKYKSIWRLISHDEAGYFDLATLHPDITPWSAAANTSMQQIRFDIYNNIKLETAVN